MRSRMRSLVLLGLLSARACCTPIPPLSLEKIPPAPLVTRQAIPSCAIEGNSDFYGLGIRIGIYLQWVTALLANWFSTKAISGNLETNTIFLLAVLVAIIVSTVQEGVQSAELIVLLQLAFGFVFSILSIWGHRIRPRKGDEPIRLPLLGSFFRLIITTAVSAYGFWFWFGGLEKRHDNRDCSVFTFAIAKVDTAGGVRTFFQIQSVVILLAYSFLFIRELLMIICFYLFTVCWTAVLSVVVIYFSATRESLPPGHLGPKEKERSTTRKITHWTKQWLRLYASLSWKFLNGKESAGRRRPHLSLYLVPFLNFWIFTIRTSVQLMCSLLFDRCPPLDLPPLIPHPYFSGSKNIWWRPNNRVWLWLRPSNAGSNSKRKATGLTDASMPIPEKNPQPKPDIKLSEWFSANNALYTGNIICIAYSILSIELTLSWNQFDGVNTVDSVGQLIPLIIGIVGLAGLFYGFTVERSAVDSTETLVEMLDPHVIQDHPDDNQARSPSPPIWPLSPLSVPPYDRKNTMLSTGNSSTEFWSRRPTRRFSIGAVQKEDILRDTHDYGEQQKFERLRPWQRYSDIRHDRNKLEMFYESDVIIEHILRDGTPIFFVEDFRKLREPRTKTEVKVSAWLGSCFDTLSALLGHVQSPTPSTSNDPPMSSVTSDSSSTHRSHGVSSDVQRGRRLSASSSNRSSIPTCSRVSTDSSREPSSYYYSDYATDSTSSSSRSRSRNRARRNRRLGSRTPRKAPHASKRHPWLRLEGALAARPDSSTSRLRRAIPAAPPIPRPRGRSTQLGRLRPRRPSDTAKSEEQRYRGQCAAPTIGGPLAPADRAGLVGPGPRRDAENYKAKACRGQRGGSST
ncbi:hypothetical protein OPT61_g9828 [Boeremia exigua]|uniref:Uncharacterized protein n=1 Tax=Boeremia exigua TaxID=749465 RepID=A0ACC2HTH8_9PLEO|nr:hypothetical protein OPT61_g9828 [Boeremia exigua]